MMIAHNTTQKQNIAVAITPAINNNIHPTKFLTLIVSYPIQLLIDFQPRMFC